VRRDHRQSLQSLPSRLHCPLDRASDSRLRTLVGGRMSLIYRRGVARGKTRISTRWHEYIRSSYPLLQTFFIAASFVFTSVIVDCHNGSSRCWTVAAMA
jgi:hypothetical protein